MLMLGAVFYSHSSSAQLFSTWGTGPSGDVHDTCYTYGDTMRFNFTGIPAGVYGDVKLVVYFEGDYGDFGEYGDNYLAQTPTNSGLIMNVGTNDHAPGFDCDVMDSVVITFAAANIIPLGSSFAIRNIPSNNVDFFCTVVRCKMRLELNYCIFGTPAQYASFSFADDKVCSTDGLISMTGTPSGGTFTGPGVIGNQFDPSSFSPGLHYVTYTATDIIGCTTYATEAIKILGFPTPISEIICEGSSPIISTSGQYGYFTDLGMTNVLDTTNNFIVPAVTASPTIYYYSKYTSGIWFTLDNVALTNSFVVDHNSATGDDRGGVAFTDSTVYIVGDNNTARFDLDLLTAPVQLPIRDGIFTDMAASKIYSLYNTNTTSMPDYDNSSDFEVDAIIALDADLNLTSDITLLSTPIYMSTWSSQNGIFAGYGQLILKSGDNDEVFQIDIATGDVVSLGIHQVNLFWGENWADWGVAGFDGADYFIYYRDWSNNIVSHNLSDGTITPISNFSNVSDLAGFMYHPINNRLYFHYEGSGQFGGSSETFGYVDASHTLDNLSGAGSFGCPSEIEYTFNTVDLGPDTTVCNGHVIVLEAGLDYNSYTWNGVNNNWNVYPVNSTGTYDVEVLDDYGCILTDAITVTFQNCLGIEESTALSAKLYPVPNNGNFTIDFGAIVTNLTVQIYDMQGKLVYSNLQNESASIIFIDAPELQSGLYMINLNSDQGNQKIAMTISK